MSCKVLEVFFTIHEIFYDEIIDFVQIISLFYLQVCIRVSLNLKLFLGVMLTFAFFSHEFDNFIHTYRLCHCEFDQNVDGINILFHSQSRYIGTINPVGV